MWILKKGNAYDIDMDFGMGAFLMDGYSWIAWSKGGGGGRKFHLSTLRIHCNIQSAMGRYYYEKGVHGGTVSIPNAIAYYSLVTVSVVKYRTNEGISFIN